MSDRPYVVLSACVSLDGYLDSAGGPRLVLSGPEDLDRVDEVRARSDAVLVGAGTVRADRPRLLVRSAQRRAARTAAGRPEAPLKVTVTTSGDLDPTSPFFTTGGEKVVVCATGALARARRRLGGLGTLVDGGAEPTMEGVARALDERGVARLLVEGGRAVHTQFLLGGLADELHLAIAPVFVGDCAAPRFTDDGSFPWQGAHRARLLDARPVGDVVLARYALSDRCEQQEVVS